MTTEAERLDQLVAVTERLTSLLADQAASFEQRRPHEAGRDLPEIGRLANLYRHEAARVRENPQLALAAGPAVRTRLMRATEAFDAVLARQGRALHAAKTINEGLVKTIANEIAARRDIGRGYGPGATAASSAGAATAITLNRQA